MSQTTSETNKFQGMKVDWEMKLLLIVSVFAFVKGVKAFSDSPIFLLVSRIFYLIGHLYFVYIYLYTNYRITKSSSRTDEEKATAKGDCLKVFRSVMIRGVIIGAIHFKTQMIPPLYVSVFMGLFSLIENDFIYQVLYSKYPGIFELLYR